MPIDILYYTLLYLRMVASYRVLSAVLRVPLVRLFRMVMFGCSRLATLGAIGPIDLSDHACLARAVSFSVSTRTRLRGIHGALDGCQHRVRHVANSGDVLRGRRKLPDLNVQLITDGCSRIIWASVGWTGATHDSAAFTTSALHGALNARDPFSMFYLVGDAAYALSPHLLTSYKTNSVTTATATQKDLFDLELRMARRHTPPPHFGLFVGAQAERACFCAH